MTVKEVKQTLANEAELLDYMIKAVERFDSSKFTNQAQFIKDSWARFLDDRRTTNESLVGEADDEVIRDLSEEMRQVQQYVEATDKAGDYTETWEKFLVCEREILKALLKKGANG